MGSTLVAPLDALSVFAPRKAVLADPLVAPTLGGALLPSNADAAAAKCFGLARAHERAAAQGVLDDDAAVGREWSLEAEGGPSLLTSNASEDCSGAGSLPTSSAGRPHGGSTGANSATNGGGGGISSAALGGGSALFGGESLFGGSVASDDASTVDRSLVPAAAASRVATPAAVASAATAAHAAANAAAAAEAADEEEIPTSSSDDDDEDAVRVWFICCI